MEAPHYRKVELQSTPDLSYLYANTVSAAREKLDLHFPPAANDDSDPMKERVQQLVNDFITRTFTAAIPSISINGIDTSTFSLTSGNATPLESLLSAKESVEYEPYDTALAARLTSLYAQLESLTTTVAQMRRDAPLKATRNYEEALRAALQDDDEEDEDLDTYDYNFDEIPDNEIPDEKQRVKQDPLEQGPNSNIDPPLDNISDHNYTCGIKNINTIRNIRRKHPDWLLNMPARTALEEERWRNGDMRETYSRAVQTLFGLKGEGGGADGNEEDVQKGAALATTVGRVERARRAVDVIEKM
ncbi:hypothetical protein FQN57_004964 [Myotisia sp. PD_48]|nr:hypothetical protein FQN57_004964 [Myotisia sp. PD_48]